MSGLAIQRMSISRCPCQFGISRSNRSGDIHLGLRHLIIRSMIVSETNVEEVNRRDCGNHEKARDDGVAQHDRKKNPKAQHD